MLCRSLSTVALIASLSACGGDDPDGPIPSPCPQADCKTREAVADAAALKAFIGTLKAKSEGSYTTGCIEPSVQVEASAAFDIDLGARPGDMPPCDQLPQRFWIEGKVEGISCVQWDDKLTPQGCRILAVEAGAVFRLRSLLYDVHPAYCNFNPVIEVSGGCEAPCDTGLVCSTTKVCHPDYDDYCKRCEDRELATCACRDAKGRLPDGETCFYNVSGDMVATGSCRAGSCVAPSR